MLFCPVRALMLSLIALRATISHPNHRALRIFSGQARWRERICWVPGDGTPTCPVAECGSPCWDCRSSRSVEWTVDARHSGTGGTRDRVEGDARGCGMVLYFMSRKGEWLGRCCGEARNALV